MLKLKGDWRTIFMDSLEAEQKKMTTTGARLRQGYEDEKRRVASKKIELIPPKQKGISRGGLKRGGTALPINVGAKIRKSLGISKKTQPR